MLLALRLALSMLGAILIGSVLVNGVAYSAAARARRRHPPECSLADDGDVPPWPARIVTRVAPFARECAVTVLLTALAPLAFFRAVRSPADVGGGGGPPGVVILHGRLLGRAGALWLARRLRNDGWRRLEALSYGWDVEGGAARLGLALDRLRQQSATEVDVVAHGLGGLVARACLRARGGAAGVGRLITLGSPHQGTALGWLGTGRLAAQVRPGSALLERLGAPDPVPAVTDCTSIYSRDDALVVPTAQAYYPGAFNIELGGIGHLTLLVSRRAYELVRENLVAESERDGGEVRRPSA